MSTFNIVYPGVYKCRNGWKAIIYEIDLSYGNYPAFGNIFHDGKPVGIFDREQWSTNGKYDIEKPRSERDIIGRWDE